jgi:hypothetical protein
MSAFRLFTRVKVVAFSVYLFYVCLRTNPSTLSTHDLISDVHARKCAHNKIDQLRGFDF